MPSKRKSETQSLAVEIVPLSPQEINAQTHLDLKSMIAQMVEEGVREAMSGKGAELQPFFGSTEISYEIKRRQTVHEQNKFQYFFEDWGCMICGTRKARHFCNGMCGACNSRTRERLKASLRKHQPAKDSIQPNFMDNVRMAREALAPVNHGTDEQTEKTKRRNTR